MNVQINQLVKSLLQKDSIEDCSLQELQQFADRHPHFGAAQLLLTKKLQVEQSDKFDEQLQKTFLYFHNPLWVEHLLNETGNATVIPAEKITEVQTPVENIITVPEQASIPEVETIPEPVNIVAPVAEPETESIPEAVSSADEQPALITPALAMNDEEPETVPENQEPESAAPVTIPALKIEPVDPNAALTFEPYHTVDYFASQGIKFKEEAKPEDKFGQQLKSFTEWLKTLRKVPVSEISKSVPANAEQKVEQMAEHSLEQREVITEAMAEVWEKQGNAAKAIDIYSKLSLLEPSKSPYFAAKIEELKKLN